MVLVNKQGMYLTLTGTFSNLATDAGVYTGHQALQLMRSMQLFAVRVGTSRGFQQVEHRSVSAND